ncbi:VOC family protein [Robertmurraya sp. P23]|uniref:VOC family protein n=1 Tax=Robertmurraya sp. P23 TaxID=3436931 RepID=UPI003D98A4F5
MANLEWDHTVHYVNSLESAIKKFHENGLIAFQGGSHKQWGTYNALSYFDLCYIEFLGVENRELAESVVEPNEVVRDSVKLLPSQEVLSRVALRTDDIEEVARHLTKLNLDVSLIMDGKRLDAQGNLIEWRMMTIAGDYQGLPYPFVIQWNGTDEVRRERLIDSGIIQEHPSGKVTITSAVFQVSNPSALAIHWHRLFGFEILDQNVTSDLDKLILVVGNQTFIFIKGDENRMQQLVFNTSAPDLKGKTITIGEGEYLFGG